ncbi:hypothetical protein GCM10007855_41950 [Aliivibrio sifiae]|uniref:Uncharacterized protein n=1 Tax=Aliivibrio sifiae TaxID=566293 RepID=A0ABQ6ALZ4_9GAMM|nr:hypothetical protein GCM10007855_41950 [Aliivibrio sifiae]
MVIGSLLLFIEVAKVDPTEIVHPINPMTKPDSDLLTYEN